MKRFLLIGLVLMLLTTGCMHSPQMSQASVAQPEFNWFNRDGSVNWDADALPIDFIAVHYSALPSDATWVKISNLQRKTLYEPRYQSSSAEPKVSGEPHSGHYRAVGGELREVFYAYHWLIKLNGERERLLLDKEVGWHSGNWNMNCRSIAICFAGNFAHSRPTDQALNSCADLITGYIKKFPAIKAETNIIGHQEVNPKTECPGNEFLGLEGWKGELIRKTQALLKNPEKGGG